MDHLHRKYVIYWLWSGAALIFLMLIIGGITRLTGSGLSMTDWNLIMGAVPPLSEAEWQKVFEQYKQFPEYQQLNLGMTLAEFKRIFFWEYLHRLLGRVIGLVFLIPFLFFWVRGYFNSRLLKRMLLLFSLGALQGLMGWIMVKSGLVDNPYVSHYRLAAHLLLAFILTGFCVWYALDIQKQAQRESESYECNGCKEWGLAVVILFFIQLFWGALTAGLNAGLIYNTFPLMNGNWFPPHGMALQPVFINFIENPGMVQWIHRILGTLLAVTVIVLWFKTRAGQKNDSLQLYAGSLTVIILVQYILGVLTLLYQVPVVLGVMHQGIAMVFWIAWLVYYHRLKVNLGELNYNIQAGSRAF